MPFEFARLRDRHVHGALAWAAASFLAGAAACSSSSGTPASHGDAAAVCPGAPQDTIGKACAVEGTVCGPQYACGTTLVSIYCTCAGGTFQCRDGAGKALSAVPACPMAPAQPPACPASLPEANLQPCTSSGQSCAYASACRGALDQCTCFPGETASGGFGKVFVCAQAVCAGDAAAPPPPPADAEAGSPGGDAAAPSSDGAPSDGSSTSSDGASTD